MSDNGVTPPSTPAWLSDLPEDLRGNATWQSFKGNEWKEVGPVLAKSFIDTKSLVGKKAYDTPKEDWKPEQWSEWNRTIGVPDSADKYELPAAELMAKAGMPQDVIVAANKKFHELGLTPRQVKGLVNDWYLKDAAAGNEVLEKQKTEASQTAAAAIRQEYGDKFEAKKGLVKSVLALGGGDLAERLEAAGFGNDPALFKALVAIGEKTMEDTSRRGGDTQLGASAGPAAALAAISELKQNKEYMAMFMTGNKEAVKKWNELHNAAYGGQK